MNMREGIRGVLNYEAVDRLPILHFGFWRETLLRWAAEGHLSREEAEAWGDGNPADAAISRKLGFDGNYYACFSPDAWLRPCFTSRVLRTLPDGSRHRLNGEGVIVLESPDAGGIPAEIDHLFKGRREWEEHYLPRLQFSPDRILKSSVRVGGRMLPYEEGGREFLRGGERDFFYGLYCGSLIGWIRNVVGVEQLAYLSVDDESLLDEMIETVGESCYRCVEYALADGGVFDFAHFWEDICYKNGPLVSPSFFAEKIGPQYRRITDLLQRHGIPLVSVDCDGCIDALIPTWLENGVNPMFPIEVGTWGASIAPWRARYGRALRGVGGMNKVAFARDRAAIDAEIERLKPLVALGGYLPCPDHRIAPDAQWELVCYYTDRLRAALG